jgi:microcystin-dependent protein
MPQKISTSKGLNYTPAFDTYVPQLNESADIQNALELFYYGNSDDGNTIDGTSSLYSTLLDFDTRIDSNDALFTGHASAIFNVHGTLPGSRVVGTIDTMTLENKTINLTNNTLTGTRAQFNAALSDDNFATIAGTEILTSKTLTSPAISDATITGTTVATSGTIALGTNASAITANGTTISATEVGYLDTVSSNIQTQLNTNTPVGTIVMYGGTTPPTGWLLCNGQATANPSALRNIVGANVPDLMGRSPVGFGAGSGLTNRTTIGVKFGTETHALSVNEMPSHNHQYDASDGFGTVGRTHFMDRNNSHAHGGSYLGGVTWRLGGGQYSDGNHLHYFTYNDATTNQGDGGNGGYRWDNSSDTPQDTINIFTTNDANYGGHNHSTFVDYTSSDINHRHTIQAQGGGIAHNNMQPSTVVNFIIKS